MPAAYSRVDGGHPIGSPTQALHKKLYATKCSKILNLIAFVQTKLR